AAWFIFLSGAMAISAMILPGISGSFILLILRKYAYILVQFGKLGGSATLDALAALVAFGLAVVIGIMIFTRFLSWLLHHYHAITLCVLIGFMIGSLYVIWPFQSREYAESIRTEQLAFDDPRVLELQMNPESPLKPEYKKTGPL